MTNKKDNKNLGTIILVIAALAAGLLIGILESFAAGYISSEYKDAIALAVLLIVLLVRPSGLMGSREAASLKEL